MKRHLLNVSKLFVLSIFAYLFLLYACADRDMDNSNNSDKDSKTENVNLVSTSVSKCGKSLTGFENYNGMSCIKWSYTDRDKLSIALISYPVSCADVASQKAYIEGDRLVLEIISENRPYFEDGKIVCGELACGSCNVDLLYELSGVDRSKAYKIEVIYRECESVVNDTGIEIRGDVEGETWCVNGKGYSKYEK